MKPRQLSDAIYQELGRKIMGQISDEIWKTIRLNDSIKDDIRTTVEHVFNKMGSTEQPPLWSKASNNPSLTHENHISAREEANGFIKTSLATPTREPHNLKPTEANDPPGFASSGDKTDQMKAPDLQENEQKPVLIQNTKGVFKVQSSSHGGGEADDDSELPPGFS